MGGYDSGLDMESIRSAWAAALRVGVGFFDTAEVYGGGESERIIGRLYSETAVAERSGVVLATKFMPSPQKVRVRSALLTSLRASLARLGVPSVDLYQIHGPISLRGPRALADALAAAAQSGLTRAVGVSNYSIRQMCAIDDALRARGVRLATNQVEYSLLRTMPETSGLLRECHDRGIVLLAYSPIGQGRLTGKYSAASPPPPGRDFSDHDMVLVDPIVERLRALGEAHGGRTPSQVALNWVVRKGAVPIPGAKNERQSTENAGALGWSLSDDEVASLDEVALAGRRALRHRVWQRG